MRYEKGHKDATRKRIIDVASRRFRKAGVEAVGIAGLMADAGLTHGGFYAHFGSKEELVREVIADALDRSRARLARIAAEGGGLEAIVRAYLTPPHRDGPEVGCAAAALASEIVRHPAETKAAFAGKVEALIELIAEHLEIDDPTVRRQTATAIFAGMMGTLQLARAMVDEGASEQILESGVEAALALARHPRR
jgi:AcrR family transcriptional regulator